MAQDYSDIFSITPTKPRKNFVEQDPDYANAKEVTRAFKPVASPTVSNVQKVDPLVASTQASADTLAGQPQGTTQMQSLQDSMNRLGEVPTKVQDTSSRSIAPKNMTFNEDVGTLPPMPVAGTFNSSHEDSQDSKTDNSSLWGKLIVGLTPYALEGLFGGGKYMGSAGAGSATGVKRMEELEQQERQNQQAEGKAADARSQFASETARKDKEFAANEQYRRDMMNQGKPELKNVNENGKPVIKSIDPKSGKVIETGQTPYFEPKAPADSGKQEVRKAYLESSLVSKASKDAEEIMPQVTALKNIDSRIKVRGDKFFNAVSAGPLAQLNQSEEEKLDKQAMLGLTNRIVADFAGKTITVNEAVRAELPAGIVTMIDNGDILNLQKWVQGGPENAKMFYNFAINANAEKAERMQKRHLNQTANFDAWEAASGPSAETIRSYGIKKQAPAASLDGRINNFLK